jgi:bidirectional [NiFe] hydrogenase diaphorase subunit
MKTVTLVIDGKEVKTAVGRSVLWAALDNGIYIPNLCTRREDEFPEASCRLCWVEVAGKARPVTACTEMVSEGMVVNTRGTGGLRLARTAYELLLAANYVNCAACPASGGCELQKIAAHLGIKLNSKRLRRTPRGLPVDASSPLFTYDPNKCVLCGRCVRVCREHGSGVLGFAHRGFYRRVTTFGDTPIGEAGCSGCTECVRACPTGALCLK